MPSPPATPDQDCAGHSRSGVSFSPSRVAKEIGRASNVDGRDARINRRENEKKRMASSIQNTKGTKKNETSKTITKQRTSPGLGAATKRQANYSEDEDYLIGCAYVNVSVNPIKGVGQKSETFWTQVLDKYVILSEKYLSENGVEIPVINKESIEQR